MTFGSFNHSSEWLKYYEHVTRIYPSFFTALLGRHPDLGGRDIKLCAIILFQSSNDEIAECLGISLHSVEQSKHRLKQKLSLKDDESLIAHLQKLAGDPPPRRSLRKFRSRPHSLILQLA